MSDVLPTTKSKKTMDKNLPFLGEDAMFNIFMKCDPRTVGRVRCTSNIWKWRLRGALFAKQNWIANQHRSGSALLGLGYSDFGDRSHWSKQVNSGDGSIHIVCLPIQLRDAGYYTIIGSDNGNLCVKYSLTGEEMELLVVNPLTRSAVHVDDESYKFRGYKVSVYAFGYLKDSYKEYRVMYLYKNSYEDKKLNWMVWHSLEQKWKTRGTYQTEIEKVAPKYVVVGGVVFWIGWGGFFNLDPTHLLGFSLHDETFVEEAIPRDNINAFSSITKINNQLGFISYRDIGVKRKLDAWIISLNHENNFIWQKLYHVQDFGIPFTPSFFNGNDIISVTDSRTTPTGSNDDLRTEVVMSRISVDGGNREIIYHQGWQMSLFVKYGSVFCFDFVQVRSNIMSIMSSYSNGGIISTYLST
ncbi:hypothetical protein PIB30_080207 [Stylosanthes scabra]|uniref:F-box associated beta-propeller type 1 domain-containing protein n=1 Tax=Stylosanthes scabra TaxID=79078 RepID=A0ABU6UU04_9FABA|nr:hypothetical protein [Stylosanthes scabra]